MFDPQNTKFIINQLRKKYFHSNLDFIDSS